MFMCMSCVHVHVFFGRRLHLHIPIGKQIGTVYIYKCTICHLSLVYMDGMPSLTLYLMRG